jgi:hypothetical protein
METMDKKTNFEDERTEILNIRKSFPFYREYEDTFSQLTNEEAGQFISALLNYQFYGELPDFGENRVLSVSFYALKGGMDAAIERYIETVINNRENGKKSNGRPRRKQYEKTQTQVNPSEPSGLTLNPNEPNLTQVNPIRKDNKGNEREIKEEGGAGGQRPKSIPLASSEEAMRVNSQIKDPEAKKLFFKYLQQREETTGSKISKSELMHQLWDLEKLNIGTQIAAIQNAIDNGLTTIEIENEQSS